MPHIHTFSYAKESARCPFFMHTTKNYTYAERNDMSGGKKTRLQIPLTNFSCFWTIEYKTSQGPSTI